MTENKAFAYATTPLPSDLPAIPTRFPLSLRLDATHRFARACVLQLPHGPVETPVFMPVGTQGTIKGASISMKFA